MEPSTRDEQLQKNSGKPTSYLKRHDDCPGPCVDNYFCDSDIYSYFFNLLYKLIGPQG